MINKAIVEIGKIPLRMSDLDGIEPDIQAALALSSYAATECFVLMRLYLDACHKFTGNDEVDLMAIIQRNVIERAWSAKLYEFWDFLKLSGDNKTSSKPLQDAAEHALAEYRELGDAPGHALARNLRHEATNHYTLSSARKNLQYVDGKSDISLLIQPQKGNAFYTMGEVVMFLGRMNRQNKSGDFKSFGDAYSAWFEWNKAVTNLIGDFHHALFIEHVMPKLDGRKGVKTKPYIPYEMVGEADQPTSPVFIRFSSYRRDAGQDETMDT